MKRRIFTIIILCIITVLFFALRKFVFVANSNFEDNNMVFTQELLHGVKSAYITTYGDKFDEIKGTKLNKLCKKLSSLDLEVTEENVRLLDGEPLYGFPWKVVLTYGDGSSFSFQFRDDLILISEQTEENSEVLEYNYKVVSEDINFAELVLSFFDIDSSL